MDPQQLIYLYIFIYMLRKDQKQYLEFFVSGTIKFKKKKKIQAHFQKLHFHIRFFILFLFPVSLFKFFMIICFNCPHAWIEYDHRVQIQSLFKLCYIYFHATSHFQRIE